MAIKFCPLKKEREFVALSLEREAIDKQLDKMKAEFRQMSMRGYSFTLLNIVSNVGVFKPDWKKLCYELIAKFMTKSQQRLWLRSIAKRYPRREAAAAVKILKTKKAEAELADKR